MSDTVTIVKEAKDAVEALNIAVRNCRKIGVNFTIISTDTSTLAGGAPKEAMWATESMKTLSCAGFKQVRNVDPK